jgi:hypothetical protein
MHGKENRIGNHIAGLFVQMGISKARGLHDMRNILVADWKPCDHKRIVSQ